MNILKVLTERRKIGNIGERAAARYLKRKGYKILKRNYVPLDHEIDIIAENREYTAFIASVSKPFVSRGRRHLIRQGCLL